MEGPVRFEAMAKPPQLYQVPERASVVDRTPRTYVNTQSGSVSFLARPPPVYEASSDARSWSRQTEDALDSYKRRNEKHRTNIDQFIRIGNDHSTGWIGSYEKSHGIDEKIGVAVSEYRLDSGNGDVLTGSPAVQSNELSEKSTSKYHATSIGVAQLEPETEQQTGTHHGQPQSHRMTKMIVKEDIEFFTALLEGHDPPPTTADTQTFVFDETETRRQSQETREREADLRRREEAQAAKADTDFFMMLMSKE
ncbi:hypothetical protein F5883DRAFT_514815 [Diaporthe sp. PMI_573]|nr:hypothetical protein F5883DRAFT_514815 [Diaporthaceae sp. PMI_573]